ncbi:MAG: hypothetical protein GQ574_28125 [Crocinitomix sp.]|nr:hypothetical protein [Crocinitomix sp.]
MTEQIDTIYIELVVLAARSGQQSIQMEGGLEIRINGVKPYEDGDVIDCSQLSDSLNSPGSYFIFSCSCGFPGCAGYEHGIQVLYEEDKVIWKDCDSDKTWCFDRQKMMKRMHDLRKEAKDYRLFFIKREINYVGFGYEAYQKP